ncbi:MAG: hypothetical protein ABFC31_03210 [Clostridiaceae bacterium]
MKTELVPSKKHNLPEIMDSTLPSIGNILNSFGLPREVIASNAEIESAWRELPREISRIPFELRDGLIARMCVATSVGLFDGAINYMWNAVILNLKARVRSFGLGYVAQLLNKKFEDDDLNDLMDSELLDLCHKLDLLSEDGFFFLDQCRDIRNNFSSAHPSIAQIDDRELINFISRCCKHGISADYTLQGIQIADFIDTVKSSRLSEDAIEAWTEKLQNTFPAQRSLLMPMLHGIYCDPASKEHARINALSICQKAKKLFDSKIESALIDQHSRYVSKGDEERTKASRLFFQHMELLNLLTDSERHSIVRNACSSLIRVHQSFDNFYNEPPFARNLYEIISVAQVPDSAKDEYVYAVATCYVGNPYGVSHAAVGYYQSMIENFSPKEIEVMLKLPFGKSIVASRIANYTNCKQRYFQALELIDEDSFSPTQIEKYKRIKQRI